MYSSIPPFLIFYRFSYLLIRIGEELTEQMKKYKEVAEETAVYW